MLGIGIALLAGFTSISTLCHCFEQLFAILALVCSVVAALVFARSLYYEGQLEAIDGEAAVAVARAVATNLNYQELDP